MRRPYLRITQPKCSVRSWAEDLSALIHADVVQIVPAIRAFEQPPIFSLVFLLGQQQAFHHWDQRQGAEAGLCFEHVLSHRDEFTIYIGLDYLMGSGNSFLFEVNGVPTEPQHLAAAQAIISGDLDAELQRVACNGVKQVEHFILAVERAVEDIFLGTVHLVCGVFSEDILLYRTLERLADDGTIV